MILQQKQDSLAKVPITKNSQLVARKILTACWLVRDSHINADGDCGSSLYCTWIGHLLANWEVEAKRCNIYKLGETKTGSRGGLKDNGILLMAAVLARKKSIVSRRNLGKSIHFYERRMLTAVVVVRRGVQINADGESGSVSC